MALTEAQVVILYVFRIGIVRYNMVMSENSRIIWRELRCESEETETKFYKLLEKQTNEIFCELIIDWEIPQHVTKRFRIGEFMI